MKWSTVSNNLTLMAQQEEGWPLGLQPLNGRVGLTRNGGDFPGSVSFNTLLTGSPTSSTDSSSDLDTESTMSFFHDNSITLGSLMGVASSFSTPLTTLNHHSRKPARSKEVNQRPNKNNKVHKRPRTWLFSICSRNSKDDQHCTNNPPSLGHFLALERERATDETRRSLEEGHGHNYGLDAFAPSQACMEPNNSLFVDGLVAPPRASPLTSRCHRFNGQKRRNWRMLKNGGIGSSGASPVLLCCICCRASS